MVMHNIRRPIKYQLFRELDAECQREYLTYLVTTYHVTLGMIAGMLGASDSTMYKIIKELNCANLFARGRRMRKDQQDAFRLFIEGKTERFDDVCQPIESEHVDQEATPNVQDEQIVVAVSPEAVKTVIRKFCMSFTGDIDFSAAAEQIKAMLGDGRVSRLEISCEL